MTAIHTTAIFFCRVRAKRVAVARKLAFDWMVTVAVPKKSPVTIILVRSPSNFIFMQFECLLTAHKEKSWKFRQLSSFSSFYVVYSIKAGKEESCLNIPSQRECLSKVENSKVGRLHRVVAVIFLGLILLASKWKRGSGAREKIFILRWLKPHFLILSVQRVEWQEMGIW